MNRNQLQAKLSKVTSTLMKENGYNAFVDVFMGLGNLDPKDYEDWRRKRIPFLERVIRGNLGRINFIMKTVRENCRNGNCKESWTAYMSWGKGRKVRLQFSKTGEENIERAYATHFLKPGSANAKAPEAGFLKGNFSNMSEDFDEPLEDFAEYMQ